MSNRVMGNLHKHLYRFMIVDLLLGIYITSIILTPVPYYFSLILILPIFAVISFKNRRENGDTAGILVLLILSLIFLLVGLQNLTGDGTTDMIQGLLLLMLAVSTFRRIRTIRDPIYKNWYRDIKETNSQLIKQLDEGEVLATCPACSTLLAVVPSKLSEDDKCPHCEGRLVK
ncbi:MAG: hypothetical protein OR994_01880 [Candidatus Poseidoniales archaeon]|nr:hypothetical protein [Candidatus Poseidoniales archaeon]